MADISKLRREIEENAAMMKQALEEPGTPEQREEVRRAARETTARMSQTPGRMGMQSPEARANIRTRVQELPGLAQFAVEATPSTIGAVAGGTLGSLLGPVGTVGGAMVGGAAGELVSQEVGVTPEDNTSLAIAGAAPLAGPVAGGAAKLGRMGVGAAARSFPQVRQALGQVARQDAEQLVETVGSELWARQTGLGKLHTSELIDTLKRADPSIAQLPEEMFVGARTAASGLKKDNPVRMLLEGEAITNFDDMLVIRESLMNTAARGTAAEQTAAREVLKGLEKDFDKLLTVQPGRGHIRVAQAAVKRGRLELALQDMDQAAMGFTKPVEGSEDLIEMNISGMRKWFFGKTNPRHAKYDEDFAESIGPIKDDINKFLTRLEDVSAKGKIGGPGSLIIQGRAAAAGAAVGSMFGGIGAGIGAVAATSVPRAFVRTLADPRSRGYLRTVSRLGQGRVDQKRWATLMEMTAQGLESTRRQMLEDER